MMIISRINVLFHTLYYYRYSFFNENKNIERWQVHYVLIYLLIDLLANFISVDFAHNNKTIISSISKY